MKILWWSGHWRLKMVWWSASTDFLLLQHISLLKLSKLNISSFSLLLSNFLSKRPLPLHSISMDLPKKLDFSLHLQTCQSSVYAVRCLDFGNSTGRTAPSAKVKVVLVQQIHQHHPQKQLLAYTWKTTFGFPLLPYSDLVMWRYFFVQVVQGPQCFKSDAHHAKADLSRNSTWWDTHQL